MSGPIDPRDVAQAEAPHVGIQVIEGRKSRIGPLDITRVLPTKGRRTIGAWCFLDLIIPPDAAEPNPMEIGPHPHIGLSTVTWLFEGEALHGDSLGTQQVIRPGQLNLMTAGNGIAHSELSTPAGVTGVQLWVAQPEGTRHGESAFEHHAELPRVELAAGEASLLVGSFGGAVSPARADTALVGADLQLARRSVVDLPADRAFEYCVAPVNAPILLDDHVVEAGSLGIVETGRESLRLETGDADTRLMLLGGEPLGEPIQMWWNFVGRDKDELTQAWQDWRDHDDDRFAPVPSSLERIDAPTPPWITDSST